MLKLTTLAAAAFVVAATPALAAGGTVTLRGCTAGPLDGCLSLVTPTLRYGLLVAPPRPAVGRGVTVVGTVETGPNICMVTPAIKVVKWSYNRMRCPK